MRWSEVCNDPTLQNLPYKIEINEWGQIVLSPASNRHGKIQARIVFQMMSHMPQQGVVITECSIQTTKGVKVADVAWISKQFSQQHQEQTPYPKAPEICIEIRSPNNSDSEMLEKRSLYLEAGAREFWLCSERGDIEFYDTKGSLIQSTVFPDMPKNIDNRTG